MYLLLIVSCTFSLSASRRTALVPLYRPQWAYNLINSEQVFENIEEDDYIESLW